MTLPDHSGYVAAAYLVFLLLLLIYLAIMAAKLSSVERQTGELLELALREDEATPLPAPEGGRLAADRTSAS